MGVTGAAVATTASRTVGVLYQVAKLIGARGRIVLERRSLAPDRLVLREIVRLSASATFQFLIETASWMVLVRIVASHGSAAVAGYTIAMRAAMFVVLPAWGIATAAGPLVGQNLGAGQPDRARKAVTTIAACSVAFLSAVSVVLVVAPGSVVGIFTGDPDVMAHASTALRIVALGMPLDAYGMVVIQAFNGAGDTRTPMFVKLACFWAFKLPLAWILAQGLGLGPRGVFAAIALAYSAQALAAAVLFRRGTWLRSGLTPGGAARGTG
jgi:putative MATE family efflux protein